MKNNKIGLIVAGIVVLFVGFYGGMVYGKSKMPARGQGNFTGQFGQMNGAGMRSARNGMGSGGFTSGEIIAKDDKTITVKLMDGGSKIILLSDTTKVSKSAEGTAADLAVGTQVSITGMANADGSINAQSVQIRPAMTGTVVK